MENSEILQYLTAGNTIATKLVQSDINFHQYTTQDIYHNLATGGPISKKNAHTTFTPKMRTKLIEKQLPRTFAKLHLEK
jgi:hypothetical protein